MFSLDIPTPHGARPINEIMADISEEVFSPTSDERFQKLVDELHEHYTREEIDKFAAWLNKNV